MSDVYTSDNVVSSIMTGDNSRAKEGILSILGQKSMDELEVRKAEVAQNMFKDSPIIELPNEEIPNEEIPEVDPYSGKDISTVDTNTHAPENPEIPVVDPYSGQPTEVLEKPHSISA